MSLSLLLMPRKSPELPLVYQHENGITPEMIYEAYPKKLGKGRALRAIRIALKKVSAPFLLEMTRRYADSWRGASPEQLMFLRYPATFYNDEGWTEPVESWGPKRAYNKPTDKPLWARIDELRNAIACHPANPNYIRYDRAKVTDAMRLELKSWREKLADLEAEQMRAI